MNKYTQLTMEERCLLNNLMGMGMSKLEISERMGKHRSTMALPELVCLRLLSESLAGCRM